MFNFIYEYSQRGIFGHQSALKNGEYLNIPNFDL